MENSVKNNIQEIIEDTVQKIKFNIPFFKGGFPDCSSNNNIYKKVGNFDWTNSFWTGMLWLSYEFTKEECFKEEAIKNIESFNERYKNNVMMDTHDLGFLYTLSCVAGYKLTGKEEYKELALNVAEKLSTRYLEKAKVIQAWGNLNNPSERGRMIIDCLMNVPLLYWAAQEGANDKFYEMAYNHALNSCNYLIREDYSSFHTFFVDMEKGYGGHGETAQGFSNNSCWARGEAWGIYGFALSYSYTKDKVFLKYSKKMSDYFIEHLPYDLIPYWDLSFQTGDEKRDSSAAAIAICGMLELSSHLEGEEKIYYEKTALNMLNALIEKCGSEGKVEGQGLILHGVYSIPHNNGVDECCLWGDYFYVEALMRASKKWNKYW